MSLALRAALKTDLLNYDPSLFIGNFLTVVGLLFSLLIGNTFVFLYTQQESIFLALFHEARARERVESARAPRAPLSLASERRSRDLRDRTARAQVSVAKALLEQVALVCRGRPSYATLLGFIRAYVRDDLRRLDVPPATLLSARPQDDPLEAIMYMTSVGTPSTVYDTVKALREARGARLGALQRKLPALHFALLFVLSACQLVAFPLLSVGAIRGGAVGLWDPIMRLEAFLFGLMTGAVTTCAARAP